MNVQHSSRSDLWYTPLDILVKVRHVLETIDLDPASDVDANCRVGATKFFTEEDNGLLQDWGNNNNIFLNPPGGKVGNKSLSILFWEKLMKSSIRQAIYMGFSIEQLQTSQGKGVPSIGEFMLCVPSKRIKFDYPNAPCKVSPSHSNVIAYVPGTVDRTQHFIDVFESLGVIIRGDKK